MERALTAASNNRPDQQSLRALFKKRNYLLPRGRRKIFEEDIDRIAALKIINEVLYRNARSGKARRAAHDLRIDFDYGFAHAR